MDVITLAMIVGFAGLIGGIVYSIIKKKYQTAIGLGIMLIAYILILNYIK